MATGSIQRIFACPFLSVFLSETQDLYACGDNAEGLISTSIEDVHVPAKLLFSYDKQTFEVQNVQQGFSYLFINLKRKRAELWSIVQSKRFTDALFVF